MIHGLEKIIQEVNSFRHRCEDFNEPRGVIKSKMEFQDSRIVYTDPFGRSCKLEPHAVTQLVDIQKTIPAEYMHRLLLKSTDDARQNFELWDFPQKGGDLLVRTFDNKTVRAILTDRYQVFSHEEVLSPIADAFHSETTNKYKVAQAGVDMDDMIIHLHEEKELVDDYRFGVWICNGETGKRSLGAYLRISKAGKSAFVGFNKLFSYKHVGDRQKFRNDLGIVVRALPNHRQEMTELMAKARTDKIEWLSELKRLERPLSKDALQRVTEFMANRAPQTKWDFIEVLLEYSESQPPYVMDVMGGFMGTFLKP